MKDSKSENLTLIKKKEYQNPDKYNSDSKILITIKKFIEENDIEELNNILEKDDIKEQTLSQGLNIALELYRSNGNSIDIINSLLK